MADRRLVYTVEIDATQAEAAGRKLREMFAQIAKSEATGGAASPMAAQVEQLKAVETQAKKTATALDALGGMDIASAPVDVLRQRLDQLRRDASQTERALRSMYEAGSTNRGAQANAQFRTFVEDVRRRVDDQTANQLQNLGYAPQKWMSREFAPEHAYEIQEWIRDEQNNARKQQQIGATKRQTAQQELEALELQQQLAAEQLAAAQVEKEIAQRRIGAIADMDPTQMGFAQQDEIGAEFAELMQSIDRLTQEEAQLLAEMADTATRAAAKMEAAQAQAARADLNRTGDIEAFAGGGAGTGQAGRMYISVSKASVEQAAQISTMIKEQNAGLAEQAAMMKRIADAAGDRYRAEHEEIRKTNAERHTAEQELAKIRRDETTSTGASKATEMQAKAAIAAANQQKEAIRSVTYAARADYEERTAYARAESRARIEQEARETAQVKAQIKAQQDAQRQATRASMGAGFRSAFSNMFSPTNLIYGAAGAVGLYSIDQVARNLYNAGTEGAQQIRQQATFEQFAARLNISADGIIKAIKRASKETITETDAMSLAAQVMAQKFATSSSDITGDMETIVAFSRRASQIFTDEQGQFLTTQEVFSRLVKFAREGNKELVDQFGLSNQRIADALGTTVKGLASANGAADRWRGLVKVLGEDLERLGAPLVTVADRIEATEARTTQAINRMKQAIAPYVANAADLVAAGAEGIAMLTGQADIGTFRNKIDRPNLPPLRTAEYSAAIRAMSEYDAAMAKNSQTASQYTESLRKMLTQVVNTAADLDGNTIRLDAMARQLGLVARGQDAYTIIMRETTEAGPRYSETIFQMVIQMEALEDLFVSGKVEANEYAGRINALAIALGNAAAAGGYATEALAGFIGPLVRGATRPATGSGRASFVESGAAWGLPSGMAPEQAAALYEIAQYRADQQKKREAEAEAAAPYSAEGQEKLRTQFAMKLHEDQAKEDRRLAEETARKAQSEWEAAAEKARQKWESAISSIPGLFGTSGVTAEQMAGAEAGIPQRFADSWLRELKDEVVNGIERPNVDIRDAAARLGIDPNADPKAIYAQVESAWRDSSLFAGGKNLDLIDLGAVRSSLDRQAASESGQQAIRDYLAGLGIGPGADASAAEPAAAGIIPTPDQAGAQAADMATAIRTTFDGETVRADFEAVGGAVLGYIHAGYASGAMTADWTGPIVDAVVAQLSGQIATMFGEEAPPP